ncbi:MAG TPA: flagellar biosynthetic protein FliR [Planctomycetaceae bacterium]|nr:flagellar biosynthetic protein FliR [Planctomycetaceae bacterium]
MPPLFDGFDLAGLSELAGRPLVEAAMLRFYALTLVLVRMSGLMLIGPVFGQPVVPANVRVFLAVALSVLVAPTLPDQEFPALPGSVLEYAHVAAGELAIGLVLGLGVFIVLSGFLLAGELIDQQSGTLLGEVFNPGLDTSGSTTGQLLYLLAVTAFLTMTPVGGHLLMVSGLVETFQTLPVGQAWIATPAIELLRDLVHQSLVLGVQVAAPLLAAMSLVALTMGFLGHTVPQINVLVVGFPVRALVSLLVLAVTVSGAARAVVDLLPVVIDRLTAALGGA